MKSLLLQLLLAAAALVPGAASAVYVYNTVDYPGSVFTDVRAINNSGRIVGYASFDNVNFFSFYYQGGAFTTLPAAPGALQISALGVNDAGVIVGAAGLTATGPLEGFIFNAGTYAFFAEPGWDSTYARAIANSGIVTGFTQSADGSASSGFIYSPFTSVFTDITIPGSVLTIAQGINTAGQVVGSANVPGAGGAQSFLRQPDGTLALFRVGTAPTRARAINDVGLIAGWMTVGGVNQGFVGTSGGFETLMVPGSDSTYPEGLNNSGQVSGLYTTGGDTVTHGFIATPVSMPTGTTSGGAYTFSVAVIPNFPIFIDPPVSVGFRYRVGKKDPLFATVRLPIGVGDSSYRVKVKGRKFTVAGGELFDFRTHGAPHGVKAFVVGCIEVGAALDPANPQAFPTELSFVAGGYFTGTMKPIVRDSSRHDPKRCEADVDAADDSDGDD